MSAQEAQIAPLAPAESLTIRQQPPIYALSITSLVSIFGNTLTAIAVPWFVVETTGITGAITFVPELNATFLCS